jgi:hypothetical protein
MEDFATFCKTEKHNKTIELQNSAKPQTGFIASRLNKDNFWNIVFFVGIVGIVGSSEYIARNIDRSLVLPITIPVIISISYILARFMNKVQSNQKLEKDKFIFGQTLLAISILTVAFVAFPFFFLEGKIVLKLLITNIVSWFILTPTLYSINKNIPISFYFHKNAWYVEGASSNSSNDSVGRSHNSFSRDISQINSPYNRRHNPINNYSATNSHYRR